MALDSTHTEALLVVDYGLSNGNDEGLNVTQSAVISSSAWSWNAITWSWFVVCELMTSIVGILGNLLVIIVTFRGRMQSRSTDLLVGNLAVADFLTSLFLIPIPAISRVPYTWAGSLYCKIVRGDYLMWTSVSASIYSLLAVSVDRFFAVVYPIRFKKTVTGRRVSVIIVCLWIGSAILMSPNLVLNIVDGAKGVCTVVIPSSGFLIVFALYTFCIRVAIPTTIMLSSQLAIARSLRREASRFKSDGGDSATSASFHNVARNRILKLTLTIVLIYVACWAPQQLAFLATNFGIIPKTYLRSPLNRVLITVAFFNCCINPIVYTLRHPRFRTAVADFFRRTKVSNFPIFGDSVTLKT
ncbi:galanin receptor 2a-like [Diadema setosum]|uniref:galanin receptor 2a-like n=1 Tax=Diadema setosum TaxID=31175 RepID=UPI003B3A77F7